MLALTWRTVTVKRLSKVPVGLAIQTSIAELTAHTETAQGPLWHADCNYKLWSSLHNSPECLHSQRLGLH